MGKHTAGPWLITDDRFDGTVVTSQSRVDDSMAPIAKVDCHWDEPFGIEQQQNARLIAAAPELLDALERSLNWLASYPGGNANGCYNQARAAIAKATGTQR